MARRGFAIADLPGFAAVAGGAFVILYLPIATLAVYSFNAGESIALWQGFSLRWYEAAWRNEAVQDATVRSLVVASLAALISTLVATAAALGTTRTRPYRGQTGVYMLINQPLMVPEIVTAVALMIFFAAIISASSSSCDPPISPNTTIASVAGSLSYIAATSGIRNPSTASPPMCTMVLLRTPACPQ